MGHHGLMVTVPSFVTHYHRAGGAPFLTLSDLDEPALDAVLAELASPQIRAVSARRFGPRYMGLRRATEARARELFEAVGGQPQRRAPHHFVLGESVWFAGLYADVAEVRVPLDALPSQVTSVTWMDSITAFGLGVRFGAPAPDPVHADRVYRVEQLPDLVARHGLPGGTAPPNREGYTGHQLRPVDSFVEVQLWADDPIHEFLDTSLSH